MAVLLFRLGLFRPGSGCLISPPVRLEGGCPDPDPDPSSPLRLDEAIHVFNKSLTEHRNADTLKKLHEAEKALKDKKERWGQGLVRGGGVEGKERGRS